MKRQELRGVALLGHSTLIDLHELISSALDRNGTNSFSFFFGESKIGPAVRLDQLNLEVGQTFEYFVESGNDRRHEVITVEMIDVE